MKTTLMMFAVAVLAAGGCKKKEESGSTAASGSAAPTAPAPAGETPSAPAPTAGSGESPACKLLTSEKLSEAVGAKFGAANPAAVQGETSSCWWAEEDGGSGRSVSITYYQGNTGKEAWKNMSSLGGEAVAGIGDEAFANAAAGSIRVRKGDNVVDVTWRGDSTPDQQKAVATEIASQM